MVRFIVAPIPLRHQWRFLHLTIAIDLRLDLFVSECSGELQIVFSLVHLEVAAFLVLNLVVSNNFERSLQVHFQHFLILFVYDVFALDLLVFVLF